MVLAKRWPKRVNRTDRGNQPAGDARQEAEHVLVQRAKLLDEEGLPVHRQLGLGTTVEEELLEEVPFPAAPGIQHRLEPDRIPLPDGDQEIRPKLAHNAPRTDLSVAR